MFGAGAEARSLEKTYVKALVGVQRGVSVGRKLPGAPFLESVPALEALPELNKRFDGAVWRVDRSVEEGVRALRSWLAPGARLLLVAELVPSAWQVARELFGGPGLPRFTREEVCEAVLLQGLGSPSVLLDTTRLLALSALMPGRPHQLDEFFAQPSHG
jgi:hypothetical protein